MALMGCRGGLVFLAQRVINVGLRPVAGDYKGRSPLYRADKCPEGALSARAPQITLANSIHCCGGWPHRHRFTFTATMVSYLVFAVVLVPQPHPSGPSFVHSCFVSCRGPWATELRFAKLCCFVFLHYVITGID